MAKWRFAVTNAGQALIASAQGKAFRFVRAHCGAGTSDSLETLTNVADPKKALSITAISNTANKSKIRVQLNNKGLQTGFNLSQIGIFAQIDSEPEVLFLVAQTNPADIVPSAADSPNYVNDYVITTAVSNAESVSAVIDSAAYSTVGQAESMEEEINQINALFSAGLPVESGGTGAKDFTNALKNLGIHIIFGDEQPPQDLKDGEILIIASTTEIMS